MHPENYQWCRYQHDKTDIFLHINYTWVYILSAYYNRLECSVKDFIINIVTFMLLACIEFDSSKKGAGKFSCIVYKIYVFCIVVNHKRIRDIH